jgi:uncharacterized membrane protein
MNEILEIAATVVDHLAALILIVGLIVVTAVSTPKAISAYRNGSSREFYDLFRYLRLHLGQTLLLGLEVLIVADIIYSILHRTMEDIVILGITVIIRISLSFFLNLELMHLENVDDSGLHSTQAKQDH